MWGKELTEKLVSTAPVSRTIGMDTREVKRMHMINDTNTTESVGTRMREI